MALRRVIGHVEVPQVFKQLSKTTTDNGAYGNSLTAYDCGPVVKEDNPIPEPPRYDIKHKRKGLFVLFSHEKFMAKSARLGNSADEKKIEDVWTKLGFEVKTHKDLRYEEIKRKINEYSRDSYHEEYDMFFCAVLTHGEKSDSLYAYDGAYCVDDLTRPFQSCRSLIGKPKVFLIQACRGECYDNGNKVCSTVQCDSRPPKEKVSLRVPKEADFLIAYATPPGYHAWRNIASGSWFVQILCECMEKYAHKWDLMSILTQVTREVAEKESLMKEQERRGKKQCPSTVSRLTALLYIFPNDIASPLIQEQPTRSQYEADIMLEGQYKIEMQTKSPYAADLMVKENGERHPQLEQALIRKKLEVLDLKQQLYQMKLNAST